MVDADRVRDMLGRLSTVQASLDRLAGLPAGDLLADEDRIASVKYHFVVAIECCIDLANHIIPSERLDAPGDYADSFRILGEAGLIDGAIGGRMQDAARFRNRLVHVYWDVDDELVVRYLVEERDVFRLFATAVATICAR